MSDNSTSIYTGPWINWSNGRVLGSTITLSARDGAILTSFSATFVTIVGAQLWKIICFVLHQSRVSSESKDGLYHQHQNVLRNSGTPGGAAWSFMLQSWYWSGRVRHPLSRSLPWALFSMSYIVVFAALSVFGSSQIAKTAGQDRLLYGSQCGLWTSDDTDNGRRSFDAKILRDSQNAAAYARSCYNGSVDPLRCSTYATSHIKWEGKPADCPFTEEICYGNNTYQMDTGLIDSHHDLGINMPEQSRIKYRKVMTCSVLVDGSYTTDVNPLLVAWNYGPTTAANYTFSFNKNALGINIGYTVDSIYTIPGASLQAWVPIPALQRTDADVHIIHIEFNGVQNESPNDDPVFYANRESNLNHTDRDGITRPYYVSNYYVGVIACMEQHQICLRDSCTGLLGTLQAFNESRSANAFQKAVLDRLGNAVVFSAVSQIISGRAGSALRASETLSNFIQTSLPSNQWEIEVSSWFNTGLAMLQSGLRDYITPPTSLPGISVKAPQNDAERAMCANQKTQTTNGTISFSVLGLAITLIVGSALVSTSLFLETIVAWTGTKRYLSWVYDGKLQLQRMAFEARGVRWINGTDPVPVTEAGQRFTSLAVQSESEALPFSNEKTVATTAREVA